VHRICFHSDQRGVIASNLVYHIIRVSLLDFGYILPRWSSIDRGQFLMLQSYLDLCT
jgi:hypothetical protein